MSIFDKLKALHKDNLEALCISLDNDSYVVFYSDLTKEYITIFQDIFYEIKIINKDYIINPKYINEYSMYRYESILKNISGTRRLYGIVEESDGRGLDIILLDGLSPFRRIVFGVLEKDILETNFSLIDNL